MYKVLIIDDEEIIREGLRKIINWSELECEIVGEAEDGEDGLDLINTLKPEIIITDIRMPELDGLKMIARIKELKHDCKVIILTGFRNFEYAQEAIRLGAFRFLLKPSKTDEITSAILEAVDEIKEQNSKNDFIKNLDKKVKAYYGLKDTVEEDDGSNDNGQNSLYLVSKAIAYIKENYSNSIDLKTVADELYISTWHLSKLLKRETGLTFVDILNGVRIDQAKSHLANPKYKIYEIAEIVGFSDVAYFTKLFKKLTGLTPMEYKKKTV